MAQLRGKLGPAADLVRTVRGVGYAAQSHDVTRRAAVPGRRSGLALRIAVATCPLSSSRSGVRRALGLLRHSYDAQARSVLHRDAVLVARLADTGATNTRPAGPLADC